MTNIAIKAIIDPKNQILPTEFVVTEKQKECFETYAAYSDPDFGYIANRETFDSDLVNVSRSLCLELQKLTGDIWLVTSDYEMTRGYHTDPDNSESRNKRVSRCKDGLSLFICQTSYNGQSFKAKLSGCFNTLVPSPLKREDGKSYSIGSNVLDFYQEIAPYGFEMPTVSTGKINTKRLAKRAVNDILPTFETSYKETIIRHNNYIIAATKKGNLLENLSTAFGMPTLDDRDHRRKSISDYKRGIDIKVISTGKASITLDNLSADKALALAEWLTAYDCL